MCSIVEEYASKKAEEARREAEEAREEAANTARATTIAFIKAGTSDEIIKNATGLTEEEIEELRLEINT